MKRIALIGNPNCGKTSIFNLLTGLNQKVGNYPGVTVDKKTGTYKSDKGEKYLLIDLPGTYSLNPISEDEVVVNRFLLDPESDLYPDYAIYVCDASNLERNLILASQVADLGIPILFVLNMSDLLEENEIGKSVMRIQHLFSDSEVVVMSLLKGTGVKELKLAIEREHLPIQDSFFKSDAEHSTYRTFRLQKSKDRVNPELNKKELADLNHRLARIREVFKDRKKIDLSFTHKLDAILTHKVLGYLSMMIIFFVMFQSVFWLASYPMDWIDSGFAWLTEKTAEALPPGFFNDFITGGILAGIGGVVIFLPQIMILFGFITILEDSGYMSRVSFLMDSLLSRVGLGGKSVVPIVSGFACAIPAIMAARNIENERKRLITIFITPFMSCSARLPVYVFLVAFIVPDEIVGGIFHLQGLFMFGLYMLGLIIALIIAFVLQFLIKNSSNNLFVLEMPIYRVPRWRNALVSMYSKGKTFVFEAGKIILAISVLLWVLTTYGPADRMDRIEKAHAAQLEMNPNNEDLKNLVQSEKLQSSYAGIIGKFIEPVIEPLGFDWKIGIAVITSFAAREVFVATVSTIYGNGDDVEKISELQNRLQTEINPKTGKTVLNKANAASLLVFFVFALQCMSTIAIVKRETNGWKWPMIQLGFMTIFAYLTSFITYQLLA
ncbi:MAG: ferrous iron transport protein B [Crocinitomicaceae bacterium]|nr:ferrous iron transport protein B [Crocinitomicaceae bacterium]